STASKQDTSSTTRGQDKQHTCLARDGNLMDGGTCCICCCSCICICGCCGCCGCCCCGWSALAERWYCSSSAAAPASPAAVATIRDMAVCLLLRPSALACQLSMLHISNPTNQSSASQFLLLISCCYSILLLLSRYLQFCNNNNNNNNNNK